MKLFDDFYLLSSVVLSLSLWHTKTPHFLNSIPYCLTNGVQFTMKLQKLLYFSHREYLKKTEHPLFNERFEPWPYGPVLPSVYEEFKSFRSDPITMFAKNADGSVSLLSEQGVPEACQAINTVWQKYKFWSGIELSKLTHQDGSAWRKAKDSRSPFLEEKDIRAEEIN